MNEIFSIILALAVPIGMAAVFIRICLRIRKGGGSMMSTVYGAVDELLDKERKNAAKEIVEEQANKKVKEKKLSEPENRN